MNSPVSLLPASLTEALGWALVHSLWQGVLVAVVVLAALRRLRRQSAAVRYAVALGGLLAQVLTFGLTAWICYPLTNDTVAVALSTPTEPAMYSAAEPGFQLRLFLENNFPLLVLLWVTGAGVFGLRLMGGWALVQRWTQRGSRPAPAAWQTYLDRLAAQMNLRRPVRLLESARVAVPMTVGWLKPVVLLPVGVLTGLSPRQLEAVLAHELAHIGRHDYLVNLVQSVVDVLFFYHPVTWWLSARVRQEREHCCDDVAVALTGNPVALAQALAALETLRPAPTPTLALAFGGQKTSLLDRVKRVLGVENQPSPRFNGWTLGLCLLLVGGLAIGQSINPTRPEAPPTPPAAPSAPSVLPPPPPPSPESPLPSPPPPGPEALPPPAPPRPARIPRPHADTILTKREFRRLDSLTRLMNAYLAQRQPELARLQKQLAEATQGKHQLAQKRLTELAQPMGQLAQQQQKLNAELDGLRNLNQQQSRNLKLRKEQQLRQVEARMNALEDRLSREAERLEPELARTEALSDSLSRLYEPLETLSEKISEISERISEQFREDAPDNFNGIEAVPAPPARAPRLPRPVKGSKIIGPVPVSSIHGTPALAPSAPTPATGSVSAPRPAITPVPAPAPRPGATPLPAKAPRPPR